MSTAGPPQGAQHRSAQREGTPVSAVIANAEPLVVVRDLHVAFDVDGRTVHAVNGVDFDLQAGETLCILGESGSGKSVTMRSLMRIHPPRRTRMTGQVRVDGHDIVAASEARMNAIRGAVVSMVFQEPMTALDPVFTVGQQIAEAVRQHDGVGPRAARLRALELLERVQVPSAARRLDAYPHELSGGLRQRAMIAMALSCRPRLLLADEPTTALDATVQIQVLLLLRELQRELGMGLLIVTHDLGVAAEVADRVAVMYAGRFVEQGPVADFMAGPQHPYARGLMGATVHDDSRGQPLATIPGAPPALHALPPGCAFAPRCPLVQERCLAAVPALRPIAPGRAVRCVLAPTLETAPC
ncbi:ABC transporter ATP-binding protein [Pseudorhodoferax sp.]|uniref:ABC transporter ATP-binding protein n=1 Tax=Pseudorhodoferax sp. TaxID=1993553 RepID=UPI002DD657B4|nr:ABC transporter ATP-binding protein [Pseudorhodoferax sp.]